MAEAHEIQKLIYTSLRETFTGANAQLRKKKAIKSLLEQHERRPQIQNLLQKGYDIDRIANLAHTLLQDEIFESTAKAKARFPEIFKAPVSSAVAPKMMQSQVTTNSVATTEVTKPKSTNSVTTTEVAKPKSTDSKEKDEKNNTGKPDIKTTNIKSQPQILPETPQLTTSPDSICLPFWYQHRIMVQIQTILEKACFNFALRKLGEIVQANAWECAEAIELNRWPQILFENQDKLDRKPLEDMEKSVPDILTSIRQIRHTAVHRLRLPARSALDLVSDAEVFAKLLQDNASTGMISTIRQHISVAVEDMEEAKRSLELKISEIEKDYAEKRIQLANEEAAMLASAMKENKENDFFANANPDDTLDALIAAHARWNNRGGILLSIDETRGPEKRHEPGSKTEVVHDPIMSVEKRAEPSGSCVTLAESQPKPGKEFGHPSKDLNAHSSEDVAMPTTTCETGGDHPERPKAVAMLDQSNLAPRPYTADGPPKLNATLHSSSTSECEYWATPCGSRSPTQKAPTMNGFKVSAATSE
ncbi:anion exchange family protein [Curvularia clavata]|uniref:Anion exchange family protein n=1 Tax=Curvularia clavata TaxID=95742 RepID=A0A9Q9DUA0_CURCL|nr:anion exchange family protein [Curvularia clavata]